MDYQHDNWVYSLRIIDPSLLLALSFEKSSGSTAQIPAVESFFSRIANTFNSSVNVQFYRYHNKVGRILNRSLPHSFFSMASNKH